MTAKLDLQSQNHTEKHPPLMRQQFLKCVGWFYVVLGFVLNPRFIENHFVRDGNIDSAGIAIAIVWFEAVIVLFGAATIVKNKSELITNLNVMILIPSIMMPFLGEAFIRAGIALNIEKFKRPDLYADSHSDDAYWKLQKDWGGQWQGAVSERVHPDLGWAAEPVMETNPLGLEEETLGRIETPNPKILFYGDSYVEGAADFEYQLPEYLHSRVKGADVLDLGVGGYGVDQIYLLFNKTYKDIPNTMLFIVGILTEDLDRVVLTMRPSPKPYFKIEKNGQMNLKGVPINKAQRSFFSSYSSFIKSYLWAFIERRFHLAEKKNRELKKEINSRLFDLFKADAEGVKKDLVFVIFYGPGIIEFTGWREEYIKETLDRQKLSYIDTKPILMDHAKSNNLKLDAFYKQGDGHHNNLGNQVIGDAILRYLKEKYNLN